MASVEIDLKSPDHFFIGGQWVKPSGDSKFNLIMPSTEETFLQVAEAQVSDIERAVAAARDAFDFGPWPRLSHAERAEYLRAIARGVANRTEALAKLWTSEMGVTQTTGMVMVPTVAGIYDYYASLAETFAFEERHNPKVGKIGLLVREPVGVVGAIVPWNGPLSLMAYKVAPALLAGCTVIVKMSPEAPTAGLAMAEIFHEIGLPPGVVNVLTADREASERLVTHPDVDKITFTGSSAAGKRIGSICGGRIARCTLELGGKSAGVVLDDYDVGAVAKSLARTAPMLSGQICSSLTRLVVSRHRHDALADAMAAEFEKIKVGDPFDPAIQMGPLAMERQRDRVEGFIEAGKAEGAKLASGGNRPSHLNRGYFIEPTVFANVKNDMKIAREEIFGPVISIIPADNEVRAIEIANDTPFGLNASVFTNDPERAYRVARQLRSGTVGHNSWRTDFTITFGGFKQSGIGREGGVEGLLPYLEAKTIILDGEPDHMSG